MTNSILLCRTSATLACLAMAAAASPLFAADRMSTGEWEFTVTMDGESHSSKRCVTAEEANGLNGDATSVRNYAEEKSSGRCSIKSYDVAAKTISYSMICGDRQVDSVTEYAKGSTKATVTTTHGGHSITSKVAGRRLGKCK